MFQYLRDTFTTAQLRAKYQRLVHERLVHMTESTGPQPVSEEPGDWQLVGNSKMQQGDHERMNTRDEARKMIRSSPHACNILRLMEAYVTGPGLQLSHRPMSDNELTEGNPLIEIADRLWKSFLSTNVTHYSFSEHTRRTWRDGECFLRKFSSGAWPPQIRFVDPETIGATTEYPDSQGILTDLHDAERPLEYLRIRPGDNSFAERIPAHEMLQTRIGVDSNEKRGVSIFRAIITPLKNYEKWLETELLARKLQSSIVLWRKVQGSPQNADSIANQASTGMQSDIRRERFSPGTILTTNHGTDIQFLQPNTNFGDAVSLGRMLLLTVAAGAGLPEFMLTSDASNSNFASTMIAEGPAVKFFQSEQNFFAGEFTRLWKWVMQDAMNRQLLPQNFFDRVEANWTFPNVVNRDRPKERMADVQLIQSGVLSRAEVARRDGVDPTVMQAEKATELRENENVTVRGEEN